MGATPADSAGLGRFADEDEGRRSKRLRKEGLRPLKLAFRSELWRWKGDAAWHFVTLPADLSDEIREGTAHRRAGFGSVRVRATIGPMTWTTSVFPDKASGSYLLPVKRAVRNSAELEAGDETDVMVEILDAQG